MKRPPKNSSPALRAGGRSVVIGLGGYGHVPPLAEAEVFRHRVRERTCLRLESQGLPSCLFAASESFPKLTRSILRTARGRRSAPPPGHYAHAPQAVCVCVCVWCVLYVRMCGAGHAHLRGWDRPTPPHALPRGILCAAGQPAAAETSPASSRPCPAISAALLTLHTP
jgi:hypothetical protein